MFNHETGLVIVTEDELRLEIEALNDMRMSLKEHIATLSDRINTAVKHLHEMEEAREKREDEAYTEEKVGFIDRLWERALGFRSHGSQS